MPVTIAIAIIPPALNESDVVWFHPIASSTRLSEKARITPRPAETTIRSRTPLSRSLYGAKQPADAAQIRTTQSRVSRTLRRHLGGVEEHAHRRSDYVAGQT